MSVLVFEIYENSVLGLEFKVTGLEMDEESIVYDVFEFVFVDENGLDSFSFTWIVEEKGIGLGELFGKIEEDFNVSFVVFSFVVSEM